MSNTKRTRTRNRPVAAKPLSKMLGYAPAVFLLPEPMLRQFRDDAVSDNATWLWALVFGRTHTGAAQPSVIEAAEVMGLEPEEVDRCFTELLDKGLLEHNPDAVDE